MKTKSKQIPFYIYEVKITVYTRELPYAKTGTGGYRLGHSEARRLKKWSSS